MRGAVFIHVFKAGGTSVGDWLDLHFPPPAAPPNARIYAAHPDDFDAPLIRGHLWARSVVHLDRTLLTVIREPEAHLMSSMWHVATQKVASRNHQPYSPNVDLTAIAEEFAATGAGTQSVFFSSAFGEVDPVPEYLDRIDAFGVTDRLRESMNVFARKLAIPPPGKPPHVRSTMAGSHPMPKHLKRILRDVLERDGQLYRYACARLEGDLAVH
jgi:hypothetical protein